MQLRTRAMLASVAVAALGLAGCSNHAAPRPRRPVAALALHRPPRRTAPGLGPGPRGTRRPRQACPWPAARRALGRSRPTRWRSARTPATTRGGSQRPPACRTRPTKLGYQLTVTDANNDQSKQIQDIKGLIAQKPDAPVHRADHRAAGQRGDRGRPAPASRLPARPQRRPGGGQVGEAFVTVIVSDFVQQGKRAAWAMAQATGGNAKIIELEGTTGSSPAIDRKKGFDEAIHAVPRHAGRGLPVRRLHAGHGAERHGDAAAEATRTPPRSTRTTTRWRWARSPRSGPPARCRARRSVPSIDGERDAPDRGRRR